jgi:type III secretory pathway component EscS
MSLPKQCLYTNKINSSYARNFQSAIAPQNGTEYNFGETIILNIPTGANLVASGQDSILKFNFNFRNAGGAATTLVTTNTPPVTFGTSSTVEYYVLDVISSTQFRITAAYQGTSPVELTTATGSMSTVFRQSVYYIIIAGSLPPGIQCSANGLIVGVPQALASLQGVPFVIYLRLLELLLFVYLSWRFFSLENN